MTKDNSSFSVLKYDQEAFFKTLEAWEQLGNPGHEHFEIIQQTDKSFGLKTTKKVSWIRWVIQRIFGKNKNCRLNNIAEVAYAIFEKNVDYLPAYMNRIRPFHLLFNKLRGPKGVELKIKFDKLISNSYIFQIAKNNELKNAYKEAEDIRQNTELEVKEIEQQGVLEAKRILDEAEIYAEELEEEARELFRPVSSQLKKLQETYDLAEQNNHTVAHAERVGQAEKDRIVAKANDDSKRKIEQALNRQKEFIESIPKIISNFKNSAAHDYAINCYKGEIVTCSKFALEDFAFFSNDTKNRMGVLPESLQDYKNQHLEIKMCVDLSEQDFATKENVERLIAIGKELYADNTKEIVSKHLDKLDFDELVNFIRFVDHVDAFPILQACADIFEKFLTFDVITEYMQRPLQPSEEIFDYPQALTEKMLKILNSNFVNEFEMMLFLYKSKKLSNLQFGEIISNESLILDNKQWLQIVQSFDEKFIDECQIFKHKLLISWSKNFEQNFEIIRQLYNTQKLTDKDLLQILKDDNLKISEGNLLNIFEQLGINQAKLYQDHTGEKLVDQIRFELLGTAGFEMYKHLLSPEDLDKWTKIYKGQLKLDQIRPHRINEPTTQEINGEFRCYFTLSKSNNGPIASKHFQFILSNNSTLEFTMTLENARELSVSSNFYGSRHYTVKANCRKVHSLSHYNFPRVNLGQNDSLVDEELIEVRMIPSTANLK